MTAVDAARAYWLDVLEAGGATELPRWSLEPRPGEATREMTLPGDLVTDLDRLTTDVGVPLGSALLAAHAKVLSVLAGEAEIVTGYIVRSGGDTLPGRIDTSARTWRGLVVAARQAEATLLAGQDFPVVELQRELGGTRPAFEAEFDPYGDSGELAAGSVLRIGVSRPDGGVVLRVRYRTEAYDADAADRIAGYHRTALARMAADPDAYHHGASLLSDAELRLQVKGLAGPRRILPDLRVHEVFERQAQARPNAVAAVLGERRWTYRELDARANQLAHALVTRGLRREEVVAVITGRNLDWMAAVIAVFKAGGVYLPIEPHFPADRIATMLARADCRLILTEPDSTMMLDQALESLPGAVAIRVDAAYAEGHPGTHLGVEVAPDQLAYVYFTSGSTGEPKGAMCEHAGLINHLYAKIDDLEIREGQVVAQVAPQCFDISLWQLVSALLVGGRTVLVEQEVILDVERFVDTIVDNRVAVLQVVPSYLDAVLSYLEQRPRELPDLRYVSVTGEALSTEVARRWFAAQTDIRLVNAYGLTETSDDTNHEVMDRAPHRDRVPLGRPVNNVHVYVVDEHLMPVPLGAAGEIVVSGVCVGRGYVNDPDRTRLAFLPDPLRPGQRLYRTGDHGRWLPDGRLEFLGRRDAQVKVAGFRIEIGEVENALARVAGIRQSAVVVATPVGRRRHLVGFYSGRRLEVDDLRGALSRWLPDYMVPTTFVWRDRLPLTGNGKVDRAALRTLVEEVGRGGPDVNAPRTPAEHQLAAAWAKVLDVRPDQIGRQDHFFERGGTSLSGLTLVVELGRVVSLTDVKRHPTLAELASVVESRQGE